jgi:hypothetical protein
MFRFENKMQFDKFDNRILIYATVVALGAIPLSRGLANYDPTKKRDLWVNLGFRHSQFFGLQAQYPL